MPVCGTFTDFYAGVNSRSATLPRSQSEVCFDANGHRVIVKDRGSGWFDRIVCWLEDKSPMFVGKTRKRNNQLILEQLIKSIEAEPLCAEQRVLIIKTCERKQRKNQILRYRDLVSLNERIETARPFLSITQPQDIQSTFVHCEADLCLQNLLAEVNVEKDLFLPVVERLNEMADSAQNPKENGSETVGQDAGQRAEEFLRSHPNLNAENFHSRCLEKLTHSILSGGVDLVNLSTDPAAYKQVFQVEATVMVLEQLQSGRIDGIGRDLMREDSPLNNLEELAERLVVERSERGDSPPGELVSQQELAPYSEPTSKTPDEVGVMRAMSPFKHDPGVQYLMALTAPGRVSENRFVHECVVPTLYGLRWTLRENGHKSVAETLKVSGLDMEATRQHAHRIALLYFFGGGRRSVESPSEEEVRNFLSETVASLLWLQAREMADVHGVDLPDDPPNLAKILGSLASLQKDILDKNKGSGDASHVVLENEALLVNLLSELETPEGQKNKFLEHCVAEMETVAFRAMTGIGNEKGFIMGKSSQCCQILHDAVLKHDKALCSRVLCAANQKYEQVHGDGGTLTQEALDVCVREVVSDYVATFALVVMREELGVPNPQYSYGPL